MSSMDRRTLVCAALGLVGCAPGNPGLFVANAVAPDNACLYDSSNAALVAGTLDTTGPGTYFIGLRYLNQLIDLGEDGTNDPPRADPNLINVREMEVELRGVDGSVLAGGAYVVPATGFVDSAEGATLGEGVGGAEIIPPEVGAGFVGMGDTTIVAVLQAIGVTAGDAEVVSPEFHFPIHICTECLLGCMRDDAGVPLCIPACLPGQDTIFSSPALCGEMGSCVVAGGS